LRQNSRSRRTLRFCARFGLARLAPRLEDFWPPGGPVWDALAVLQLRDGCGALLIEAKSHPKEIYGPGCQAGASGTEASLAARAKIENALVWTQRRVGFEQADADRWMKPLRPNEPGHSSV